MKLQQIQAQWIKEAVVIAVAVVGVFALYMAVSSWAEGRATLRTTAESTLNQQTGEIAALRTKLANAGKNQERYADIMQTRNTDIFAFDNAATRTVLETLLRKHRITVVGKLEYSGETPVELPELSNASLGFVVRRDTTMKLGAITDLHVYAFIDSLMRALPGIIDIKRLKIIRKAPLDNEILAKLSVGGNVEMVEADMVFDWYAITAKDAQPAQASNGGTP